RELRCRILTFLGWIPDGIMLRIQYWLQTGRVLNIKNPKRFTEKLQVYKLKYRNPKMLRCTDKYEVRKYIEDLGLGEYLIPLIGVYNNVDDISYKELPSQFVAKSTNGGGGNQVLVCSDKASLSESEFITKVGGWMSVPKAKKTAGREWAYMNGFERRIIVEKLLGDGLSDIPDYKFYCFNGEPKYCQLIQNRTKDETIDFYDMEWEHMPFYGLNPLHGPIAKSAATPTSKPKHYEEMKAIAEKLSKDYPFVRVDLYDTPDGVFFGELTFYPASGYGVFNPDEYDFRLGELLDCEDFV
ncbi:MAG: ATP-grasp fold amidoligase family protein, partial [Bacteroidia bacterium]|nr:ATP-grasp fold amidoligase family protein [Bacteroidia bacterium]